MTYELDELDRKILRELQENARHSFREIAKRVDSTAVTVINHVRKMEDAGVITGYSVDIDYREIGYHIVAAIELIVKGKKLKEIEKRLFEHPNVTAVYEITGDTDILIITRFQDRDELGTFVVEELLDQDDIEKTITHMAFDTYMEQSHVQI